MGHGRSFEVSGDAYDRFMGRYSRPLADVFADAADVSPGQLALDVGCGPGALTSLLVERLGPDAVRACDPSTSFVAACARRHPGVDVRVGRAEAIPFADATVDRVLSQLVLHFVDGPAEAAREFRRVLRPGGIVAATVWDVAGGMEMLRHFWDAALAVDPEAPDEARTLRYGGAGEIVELFDAAGFGEVRETTLEVASTYDGFDELWAGLEAGIGPAGSWCVGLPAATSRAVREELFVRLGSPSGSLTLAATARCATGRAPA